ncbi:putative membrane protein [Candidatus Protochlamydia naegleriophila]|uniref:Putative membrane protein n=1 Tax=Candidatus Protochlamydia naegleriophila TaxID=389348 RepID=A0A0U5JCY5_9BACT|nr:hypothetical protein [Candidatus Protochlamydia naegleriophila]CUI15717.1 putative membrane protein [Candidatus Protochlamydia naegleriophila]
MPIYINNSDDLAYQRQKRDYESSVNDAMLLPSRPFNLDREIEGRKEKVIDGRSYVKMGKVDKEEGFLRVLGEVLKLGLTTGVTTIAAFTILPLFSVHYR